jgi:hypothetical protein
MTDESADETIESADEAPDTSPIDGHAMSNENPPARSIVPLSEFVSGGNL